jgi:hypothetical protein
MLLLLIAFFVFVGADAEKHTVMVKALLGRLRVRDVMSTQLFSVPADISVRDVAERLLRELEATQHDWGRWSHPQAQGRHVL